MIFNWPYPDIQEFLTYKEGQPEELLKPKAATMFSNMLLAWHIKKMAFDTRISLLNMSKNKDEAVENALQWIPREKATPENYDRLVGTPHRWDLRQFNCDDTAILKELLDRWEWDCFRIPELRHHNLVVQSRNRARKAAKEFIMGEFASNITLLDKFDKVNDSGCFLYGGVVYHILPSTEKEGEFWLSPGPNEPDLYLLTDTDPLADDETYEKEEPELMKYLDSIWLGYRKQPGDKEESRTGNYAVDVFLMQIVKAFVRAAVREVTFLTGMGLNGKSVLLKGVHKAYVNSRNKKISPVTMVSGDVLADHKRGGGSAENKQKGDRSLLRGRRLAIATEGLNTFVDGDFVKPMTVGELCRGGGNYKDNEDLFLHCLFMIGTNNDPRYWEDTPGIDRRNVVLRCEEVFNKDHPHFRDPHELETWVMSPAWGATFRRKISEEIRYWVEEKKLQFPTKLPGALEENRKEILAKGKDPIQIYLDSFFETGQPKRKVLLGGGSDKHGYSINKRRFYGVALVVRLLCEKQGLLMKNYKNPKLEKMMKRIGGEMYAGNANIYRNIVPKKELLDFLQEETGSAKIQEFLYDRKGGEDESTLPEEVGTPFESSGEEDYKF